MLVFIHWPPHRGRCPTWSLQKVLDLFVLRFILEGGDSLGSPSKGPVSGDVGFGLTFVTITCPHSSTILDGDLSKVSLDLNFQFLAKNEQEFQQLDPIVLPA